MYNLDNIRPEEKDKLLMELLSRYENDVSSVPMEGAKVTDTQMMGDQTQDEQMLEPILKVLDAIIDKLEEVEQIAKQTASLVQDDLFGGIEKMYNDNLRAKSVDGLRGKYGDMFAPHMDALSELAPGEDIYDALHEILEPLRGGEGWDDEKEFGAVKGAADAVAQKIASIRDKAPKPEGAGVEVVKVEAAPANESPEDAFFGKVRKMKAAATSKGF